jgi:hypothetical protein
MAVRMDSAALSTSLEVRERIIDAVKLDLVGPWAGHALSDERLPGRVRPSNWYLTGFLIPSGTPPEQSADLDEDDDVEEIPESAGLAEESNEERKAAKKGFFPSSMGLSFLVPSDAATLTVTVRWGDYGQTEIEGTDGKPMSVWQRRPREEDVALPIAGSSEPLVRDVPDSGGLQLHVVERLISAEDLAERIPKGVRSASVFLVNHRLSVAPDEGEPDIGYAFQPEIEVRSDRSFVPRPDLRGALASEWEEQVADLHYSDTPEYATGHGVSAEWEIVDGTCSVLRSSWVPSAEVEKTETVALEGVELSMDVLGKLADRIAVEAALRPLVAQYRNWINAQRSYDRAPSGTRRETAEELLRMAAIAADRIDHGITVLVEDEEALDAFRVANRAVARALRKRVKLIDSPRWHAFQLAFLLLNLPGLADRTTPTVTRWTCSSSRPAAARPRPTSG